MKRFLRRPAVIVSEMGAVALAGILGASLPQAGTASLAEFARLRAHGPIVTTLVGVLELDHVFRSAWFLAATLLATASLSVVIVEQIRRARLTWRQRPTEAQLRAAPLRAEFDRPRQPGADHAAIRTVTIQTSGRLGLLASPILHLGVLLVVVAGVLRALLAVDAVVDLVEGETLPPTAEAWSAQWPGVAARPFRLAAPLRLDAVRVTRYASGALRELSAAVSLDGGAGGETRELAINRQLDAAGGRLSLATDFGPAALLEWREPTQGPTREAILLGHRGPGAYEGAWGGPGRTRLFLRADLDADGRRPRHLEVRVLEVGTEGRFPLVFAGVLPVGSEVVLPGGVTLRLHALPLWARLRGSRDPALPLAYLGFGLVLAGATLLFTVVTVDTCVSVAPAGDRERVFVALRPRRFAPLFEERFAQLVRAHGGPA